MPVPVPDPEIECVGLCIFAMYLDGILYGDMHIRPYAGWCVSIFFCFVAFGM